MKNNFISKIITKWKKYLSYNPIFSIFCVFFKVYETTYKNIYFNQNNLYQIKLLCKDKFSTKYSYDYNYDKLKFSDQYMIRIQTYYQKEYLIAFLCHFSALKSHWHPKYLLSGTYMERLISRKLCLIRVFYTQSSVVCIIYNVEYNKGIKIFWFLMVYEMINLYVIIINF